MMTRVQGDCTSFYCAGKLDQGHGSGSSYTVPLDLRSFLNFAQKSKAKNGKDGNIDRYLNMWMAQ